MLWFFNNARKVAWLKASSISKPEINLHLSSKIASYVDKQHFSSERLLDNRLVVSRKHDKYSISLAADYQTNAIGALKQYNPILLIALLFTNKSNRIIIIMRLDFDRTL